MYALRKNLLCMSLHTDPGEFCEAMAERRNEDDGKIIFGQVSFAKSLMRDCYVGILENPKQPAAIAILKNGDYIVHIYVPEGVTL